jgi:tetratricopeptide (TPR) repeat protein
LLAIESDPQSAAIYEDYAEFLSAVGQFEEAVDAGLRSYKLDPLTPLYITAYAEALVDVGDYAAAKRFYNLANQHDNEPGSSPYRLLSIKLREGNYDEVLLQASDPTSRLYDFREFLTALIDYAEGKTNSIPEVSANPETLEELVKGFYAMIVLMNLREVDAVIKISGNRLHFWMQEFFSPLWERDEFHQYVNQAGLVDFWRQSGKWGYMCRPLGDDDFECGIFD